MSGLLNFLNTEEGRLGLGLLAAGGPQAVPMSFGQRIQGAMAGADAQKQNAMKSRYLQSQMDENDAQTAAKKALIEAEQRKRAALPSLFGGGMAAPGMMPGQPMGGAQASGGGALDWQAALAAGYSPDEIMKLAGLPNAGRTKVARTIRGLGADGRENEYQVDEYGQKIGEGFGQYRAPISVNQGDRETLIDAFSLKPVTSLQKFQTADSKASNAVTMRGQNMADSRAREANQMGKIPQGYRATKDGGLEAIPGGPADLKAGAEGQKRTGDAKDVLSLLNEVDTLLPKSTGSYAGVATDFLLGEAGLSTPGAQAGAQLKALQGALISKMPKMSGPQSDKDVQLYREMAGQVGDMTVPVQQRQAASKMIRRLNEKYAGMAEGSSAPAREQSGAVQSADFKFVNGKLVKVE